MGDTMQFSKSFLITPHAQRERGKVIDRGVHIIGERAKRARHSQVCSIENRGYIYLYIYILYIYSTCNFVLITRKEGGA